MVVLDLMLRGKWAASGDITLNPPTKRGIPDDVRRLTLASRVSKPPAEIAIPGSKVRRNFFFYCARSHWLGAAVGASVPSATQSRSPRFGKA